MINHFRTLLLNLPDAGNPDEHISKGFVARTLSGKPLSMYQVLFPSNSSRARKLELAQAYLELLEATRLSAAVTSIDTRITYDLKEDFKNFKQPSIDLNLLFGKLSGDNSLASGILQLPRQIEDASYDNIWSQHPNKLYRTAGLIAAYVLRLS